MLRSAQPGKWLLLVGFFLFVYAAWVLGKSASITFVYVDERRRAFPSTTIDPQTNATLNDHRKCLLEALETFGKAAWDKAERDINACGMKLFPILDRFLGKDSDAWAAEPATDDHQCTLLSIGIAADLTPAEQLRKKFPKCRFIGADPAKAKGLNFRLKLGGEHVEVVVGELAGADAKSTKKPLPSLEFSDLLRKRLGSPPQLVDHVWMDAEGLGWEILAHLFRRGGGDEVIEPGYSLCQWNIHLHHSGRGDFTKLIRSIVEEGGILPVHFARTSLDMHTYWFNFFDERCRRKYPF